MYCFIERFDKIILKYATESNIKTILKGLLSTNLSRYPEAVEKKKRELMKRKGGEGKGEGEKDEEGEGKDVTK